jgi:zinc transport system permease protein
MIDTALDALHLPFMQRALVAGLLVGGLASYYGVFVVQRQLSFLGVGLSHAAFGGVALGLLLGVNPLWVAAPFTIAVALAIDAVSHSGRVSNDTAIGVFFAVAIALGVVFLTLKASYTADAFAYLFGSILAVRSADLWAMGGLAVVTVGALPWWGRWAYATFDRDLAKTDGVPVRRDDALLSVLLAATIVAAVKLVGIVLVAAFLVIPAAAARLLTATFRGMTLVSVGFGMLSAVVGLWSAYGLDVPSGAAIILVQALGFFVALAVGRRSV